MLTTFHKFFFLLILLASTTTAKEKPILPKNSTNVYRQTIQNFYQSHPNFQHLTIKQRLSHASDLFLGQPYILGALGEGPTGVHDTHPIYRTDGFDCLTYVSTVLALGHANNLVEFEKLIPKVRYQDGQVSYLNRNHFTSVDWNPHNTKLGFIRDITHTLLNQSGQPVAKIARATINKPRWYQYKSTPALQALAKQTRPQPSEISYIPFDVLFDSNGRPNLYLFAQIPDMAIIEIVRPNWPVAKKIGTHLQISHLGFAIFTPKGFMYRDASSRNTKVTDTPLIEYLATYLSSPTAKGIHILATH